jgi:osmotically-inducible protein OsmY
MYGEDVKVQQNVLEELDWEPIVNAADVGVTVKNGVVTLSGSVESYAEKREAERVALRLKGVKAVANELDVRLTASGRRSDAVIAAAALNAIKWNVYLPDEKIKLKVEDSWVTLEGEVEWNYQRDRAEKAVRPLAGVRGVTNLVTVRPRVSPGDIKGRIRKSLDRIALEDSQSITVAVSGSEVTLSGSVHSLAERNEAERAAWAAPGVTSVHDMIMIRPLEHA